MRGLPAKYQLLVSKPFADVSSNNEQKKKKKPDKMYISQNDRDMFKDREYAKYLQCEKINMVLACNKLALVTTIVIL